MTLDPELIRACEAFFRVLDGSPVLAVGDESFHLSCGVLLRVAAGRITAAPAEAAVPAGADVTRLGCDERTLRGLLDGSTSFWEAVIPMSETAGAIVFVDNWMAKKGPINRFGRLCRLAQERHGLTGAEGRQGAWR